MSPSFSERFLRYKTIKSCNRISTFLLQMTVCQAYRVSVSLNLDSFLLPDSALGKHKQYDLVEHWHFNECQKTGSVSSGLLTIQGSQEQFPEITQSKVPKKAPNPTAPVNVVRPKVVSAILCLDFQIGYFVS